MTYPYVGGYGSSVGGYTSCAVHRFSRKYLAGRSTTARAATATLATQISSASASARIVRAPRLANVDGVNAVELFRRGVKSANIRTRAQSVAMAKRVSIAPPSLGRDEGDDSGVEDVLVQSRRASSAFRASAIRAFVNVQRAAASSAVAASSTATPCACRRTCELRATA